jgi:SSS family solute:Na+ symporter
MKPHIPIFMGVYFAAVLCVGIVSRRRMKGLDDFFLAFRRLSGPLVALSLTASWFGATSILVSTDEAFRAGPAALWLVGIPAVTTLLILLGLVRPLRRTASLTLPELAEMRYGGTVQRLASILIVWYMALLAASQMVALGIFLQTFVGRSYLECLVLATAVVLIYSLAGGLRSVVATDIIQCLLLAASLTALVVFLSDGSAVAPAAAGVPPVESAGGGGLFVEFGENGLIFLSFVLAWTISPIALQRIQSARDERAARFGLGAAAVMLSLLFGLVLAIGILSRPLFSGRALSGPLLSTLISDRLGPWLGGLLFASVLAAVMSTLDTALNAGALALTKDVFCRLKPIPPERLIGVSRLATVLMAAAALAVAWRFQSILKTIGLASEIMAAGFFVPGLAMFFVSQKRPLAGLLGFGLGGGFAVLSFLSASGLLPLSLPVWPHSVPCGLALSVAGYLCGSFLDRSRQKPAAGNA